MSGRTLPLFPTSSQHSEMKVFRFLLIGDAIIIVVTFCCYIRLLLIGGQIIVSWQVWQSLVLSVSVSAYSFLLGLGGDILQKWTPFILYLVFRIVGEAISTHWGPLINDYFDTRAAKRIFTLLGAVTRFSYIIGALSLAIFPSSNLDTIAGGIGLIDIGLGCLDYNLDWLAGYEFDDASTDGGQRSIARC